MTITDRRNRLSVTSIEAIECLHWWTKGEFIDGVLNQLIIEDEVIEENETMEEIDSDENLYDDQE